MCDCRLYVNGDIDFQKCIMPSVVHLFYGKLQNVHLKHMMVYQVLTWLVLIVSMTNISFGQTQQSEQQLKNYLLQLKATKVDSILILKTGCTGCEVKYSDTSEAVSDGQSICVMTKYNGQYKTVIFDDRHIPKVTTNDTCSLFDFISRYKKILGQKEAFYQNLKIKSKSGFYPPRLLHYSFEELEIYLPNFTYNFEIRDQKQRPFWSVFEQ
jgi:hypothetical protein